MIFADKVIYRLFNHIEVTKAEKDVRIEVRKLAEVVFDSDLKKVSSYVDEELAKLFEKSDANKPQYLKLFEKEITSQRIKKSSGEPVFDSQEFLPIMEEKAFMKELIGAQPDRDQENDEEAESDIVITVVGISLE